MIKKFKNKKMMKPVLNPPQYLNPILQQQLKNGFFNLKFANLKNKIKGSVCKFEIKN